MVGYNGNRNGKSIATLTVLALVLAALLPFAAATSESPATTASSNATLSAFADGSVSKTLTFAAGADASALVNLRLPSDAAVADASLQASASGTSGASTGALVFDIGADGTADAAASVSVLGATHIALPTAAIEAYLDAHGAASSTVDVPVRITGAASGPWQAVVAGVDIEYATEAQLQVAPTFVGQIGAAAVVAGQTNFSAVDLGSHFASGSGGNLTFSTQLAADAQTSTSGVSFVMNGTRADIRASNPDFWGEVQVRFAGADANGQVAFSNEVTVHVTPRPVTVPTVRTDARLRAQAVPLLGCGSPGLVP